MVAEDDEGGVGLAGEAGEANGGGAGEEGGTVEHDEGEGAAAQQDVGAPGGARGVVRADHPDPLGVAQMGPVACVERALGVDVGHPAMRGHRGLHDGASECRLAAPGGSDDLAEPAAW